MTRPRLPLYRRLSLRARMVLITGVVVTAVLLIGGLILIHGVRSVLLANADDLSRAHSEDLALLAAAGDLPKPIPLIANDEAVVQIVSGGRVLAASTNTGDGRALDLPDQPPGRTRTFTVDRLPIDDDGPYRVVARGFTAPTGPATIFVAVSVGDIDETAAAAIRVGAFGLPVLVLVVSGAMWLVIGRTLAPVEAIRSRADAITGRDLQQRVPEPPQQDEIGRLARTVNAMLSRLEDNAERQRRFVGDAAHELRNPLASMGTALESLRDGPDAAEVREITPDLLDETIRMQRLVEQLLLLARTDAGTLVPSHTAVDLDDIVDAAAERCAGDGVHVDLAAVEPVQVLGDPSLLEQVVSNLLDNALRHANSSVRVTLAGGADFAVLTVDDDGPGIAPHRRQEVFERFSRLDAARGRNQGGVGLGLAIVADIVQAHGGTVNAEAAPAGGARFQVQLPLNGRSGVG